MKKFLLGLILILGGFSAAAYGSEPKVKDKKLYPSIEKNDPNQRFNILSLDAGGGRSVIQAFQLAVLQELMKQFPATKDKHVTDLFDVIAGSDMGGFLALYLTSPGTKKDLKVPLPTPIDALRLFCFARHELYPRERSITSAVSNGMTYDTARFEKFLESLWAEQRLSQCRKPVIIAGCSTQRPDHEGIGAKSDDPGWAAVPLVQVARMSTAIPGIFEPETRIMLNSRALGTSLSGALREPNPARFCLDFYTHHFMGKPKPTEITLYSLGSGDTEERLPIADPKLIGMGPQMWDLLIKTRSEDTHLQLRHRHEDDQNDPGRKVRLVAYYRSQIQLDAQHAVLDHRHHHTLAHLLSRAREQVHQPDFLKLSQALLDPFNRQELPIHITTESVNSAVRSVLAQLRTARLEQTDPLAHYNDHVMMFHFYRDFRKSYAQPANKQENNIRLALQHPDRQQFFRMLFSIEDYSQLTQEQVNAIRSWIETAKTAISRHNQSKKVASKLKTLAVTGRHEKYLAELNSFLVGLKIAQTETTNAEDAAHFYQGYFYGTREPQEIEDILKAGSNFVERQEIAPKDKALKLKNVLDSCINLQSVFTQQKGFFSRLKDGATQMAGLGDPDSVGMHKAAQERLITQRTALEAKKSKLELAEQEKPTAN